MPITFTNPKKPSALSELTDIQQEQLVFAGKLYDGVELSAAERLSEERAEEVEDPEDGMSFHGMLELWDVVEDGEHRYDAILYMADSGVIVEKGTTTLATERIQAYFSGGDGSRADDDDFSEALDDAYKTAKKIFAAQLKSKAVGPWGAYQAALDEAMSEEPAVKKRAAKKVTKKPAAKATKRPAAKKSSTKKATKKPVSKKPAAKKPVKKAPTKKPSTKKTTKKPTPKKTSTKKPAAKKAPAKKKSTKKTASKKPSKK